MSFMQRRGLALWVAAAVFTAGFGFAKTAHAQIVVEHTSVQPCVEARS
jgi:hypothetical protein